MVETPNRESLSSCSNSMMFEVDVICRGADRLGSTLSFI